MTNTQKHQAELLEERLGLRIAAVLSDANDALPHDIGERLRHARMQAVARRKRPQAATADLSLRMGNSLALGGAGHESPWWQRASVLLPVLALLVGLVAINRTLEDDVAHEMAKVDAALLIDDLPPAAYSDPGFQVFLKLNRDKTH